MKIGDNNFSFRQKRSNITLGRDDKRDLKDIKKRKIQCIIFNLKTAETLHRDFKGHSLLCKIHLVN